MKTDEAGRRPQEVKDCGILASIESAFRAARRPGLQAWGAISDQRCATPGPPPKISRLDSEWGNDLAWIFWWRRGSEGTNACGWIRRGLRLAAGRRCERRFGVETKKPTGGLSGSAQARARKGGSEPRPYVSITSERRRCAQGRIRRWPGS